MDLSSNRSYNNDTGRRPFQGSDSSCFACLSGQQQRQRQRQQQTNNATVRSYERLLAQSLTQMTVHDRETIFNDLHGVPNANSTQEEEAARMSHLLSQMEASIQQQEQLKDASTSSSMEAYRTALSMNRNYVMDRNRLALFLRAEQYQPVEAADRMMRHYEWKQRLFGSQKLTSTILLQDLDEDARSILDSGTIQEAPVRDVAGRTIVLYVLALRSYQTVDSVLRAQWYFYMTIVERNDKDAYRGLIGVGYFHDSSGPSISGQLRYVLPFHFAAVHICLSSKEGSFVEMVKGALVNAAKPKHRARYRVHVGSHVECQYELTSFGIPMEALPISPDGVVDLAGHREWIRQRIEMEEQKRSTNQSNETPLLNGNNAVSTTLTTTTMLHQHQQTTTAVGSQLGSDQLLTAFPLARDYGITDNDILFGRQKSIVAHVGNERFRKVIDRFMTRYQAAPSRREKTIMADSVVRLMKERKGRFLMMTTSEGGWAEVSHKEARKKTAHAFRNRKSYV